MVAFVVLLVPLMLNVSSFVPVLIDFTFAPTLTVTSFFAVALPMMACSDVNEVSSFSTPLPVTADAFRV